MTKTLRHTTLSLLALLLAGCTADERQQRTSYVPIKLTCSISDNSATRALTEEALQDASFQTGQLINVYCYQSENLLGSGAFQTKKATNGVSALEPVSGKDIYYPADQTTIDIYGFYPASKVDNNTGSFTVEQDQSTKEGYQNSDLMWGVGHSTTIGETVRLQFQHKMARIQINVTGGGVNITEVKVLNLYRKVDISDRLLCTLASVSGIRETVTAYRNTSGEMPVISEIVVPAQSLLAGDFIVMTINGTEQRFQLKSTPTLESGKSYQALVSLTTKEVRLVPVATIRDWNYQRFGISNPDVTPLKYQATGWMDRSQDEAGRWVILPEDDHGYFFTFGTAISDFGGGYGLKSVLCNDNKYYHMPTAGEQRSTIPQTTVFTGSDNVVQDFVETEVEVHGKTIPSLTSKKCKNNTTGISYMLRFEGYNEVESDGTVKNNKYRSAWRYYVTWNGNNYTNNTNYIEIESVYLGNNQTYTFTANNDVATNICSEKFWEARRKEGVVVRRKLMHNGGLTSGSYADPNASWTECMTNYSNGWRSRTSSPWSDSYVVHSGNGVLYSWTSTAVSASQAVGLKLTFAKNYYSGGTIQMRSPRDGQCAVLFVDNTSEVEPNSSLGVNNPTLKP